MTVLVCPACGRENREGKYCSVCGCYLPRLFTEERPDHRSDFPAVQLRSRIGSVVGRPTNTDALLIEQIGRLEQLLSEYDEARVKVVYDIAKADLADLLRAGVPWSWAGK